MELAADTLDDVLKKLYPSLLQSDQIISTSRGQTRELTGVLLELRKPRARLSRSETRGKPFSCLGELLWYLTKQNALDFIQRYIPRYANESDDGITVYGGYGPRLFNHRGSDQVNNVISLLRERANSRRAVVQLFDAEDIASAHKEIPCTTTLQFLVRNNALNAIVTMRSNDAFMGLPHDIFCFTMLQEIIAASLGLDLGTYRHFVGSMHFYNYDYARAQAYIDEGFQERIEMPEMPRDNLWSSIEKILEIEPDVRAGNELDADALDLHPYWRDLIRLLQVFMAKDNEKIDALKKSMTFQRYGMYIHARMERK